MFTGIITAIGLVKAVVPKDGGGIRAKVEIPASNLSWNCAGIDLGASISCDGCCLTVVERDSNSFSVDISEESRAVTTLNHWAMGDAINLERALKMGDELGGHIVSGHIDGIAEITKITNDGDCRRLTIAAPADLAALIAPKGSVTLDGISLTVNEVNNAEFGVMVIPHTWTHTKKKKKQVGGRINLEADMLARYVARILSFNKGHSDG